MNFRLSDSVVLPKAGQPTPPLSAKKLSGPIGRLMEDFLGYLRVEKNASPLTIRDYRHYLSRFLFWLISEYGQDLPVEKVDTPKIRTYRLYLAQLADSKGNFLSATTQGYHVIAIRAFLKFLIKNDYAVLAPEKIDLPKSSPHDPKYLSRERVEILLSQPEVATPAGLRDKAILELLFSTGLRVSELVSLNRETINLERREFGVVGKGRHERVVFLSWRAVEWIGRYVASRRDSWEPLFINYRGAGGSVEKEIKRFDPEEGERRRLTTRSVQRILEKYAAKAHLPFKATPHTMRHSFATDLLYAGADLRSVQAMLGHKNVSTTQIYTHVTDKQLHEVYDRFHSGNK